MCNDSIYKAALIVDSSTNGASVMACLLAVVMVFTSKLYRKTVYRLALYQVLAGEVLSLIHLVQIVIISYDKNQNLYSKICEAFAYLTLFAELEKLLLTVWVTMHLFAFAVLHRNLRRCEVVYVATSLLVPAAVAGVPFATASYGLAGSWCWIIIKGRSNHCYADKAGIIEQFALWYGPSMVLLLIASITMVVIVVILARRWCMVRTIPSAGNQHAHRKALKQMIPLAAYPIVYFAFNVPPFIYRVYRAANVAHHNNGNYVHDVLAILTSVCTAIWSLGAGLTLIAHIIMTDSCPSGKKNKYVKVDAWT